MKRVLALLLAICLAAFIAGCSAPAPSAGVVSQPETSSAGSEPAHWPVTITDHLGRVVTLSEEPQRLVSGYYITTSLLLVLGLQDKLVGVEAKAGSRPLYSMVAPKILELPSVGTAKEFDLEGCAALEPDLVILPVKLKDTIPALEQLGITVLAMNPENTDLLADTITLVGEATGAAARADQINALNTQYSKALQAIISNQTYPRVYLAGNSSLLRTAGAGMYQNEMLALAGGQNVAAELKESYWVDVSYEQLIAWDPEVIVLASDASYTVADVLADPALAQVDAVRNARVYHMPGGVEAWDSPVPTTLLGSMWLASKLHPEQFEPERYMDMAKRAYKTFYGIELDQALFNG